MVSTDTLGRSSRAARWLRFALVLAALLVSGTALGQTRQERAKEMFERGRELYAQKKYDEALETLMQAYVLDPNPVLVYNIARIHEDKDDLENAVRFFENYLKISPRARDKAAVVRRIKDLQKVIKTRPPRGYLSLDSTPSGATIRVDGLVVGQSPMSAVPLAAGRHSVEVSLDGHEAWRQDVGVTGGRTLTLTAVLKDRPTPVFIETVPAGADVSLIAPGGVAQSLGRSPCSALLAAGAHSLEVKALGYQTKLTSVQKIAGEPLSVRIVLDAENTTGELTVMSTVPGAHVQVDGHDVGSAPLAAPLLLRAATVDVQVTAPGYEPYFEKVVIVAGGRHSVMARLRSLGGAPVVLVTESRSSTQRVAGWTTLGLGIAGVVTGASLHTAAKVREYDFTHNGTYVRVPMAGVTTLFRTDISLAGALAQEETTKALELGAFISYGVGGALIITGAILLATDDSQDLGRLGGFAPDFVPLDGGAYGAFTWTF